MGAVGPRFVLEAVFLVALATGAGLARLSAGAIVAVMAVGWLLVSLLELAVWAEGPRFSTVRRRAVEVEEPEEPDEVTPMETVEPAAVTEIREPEPAEPRGRFRRRRRAASGGA